jgi:hypothetical protein
MAGFTPEERRYKLDFAEGHPLHGLEVTMGSLTMAEYNGILKRSLIKGVTQETIDANDAMIELFVSKLISWNLTDREGKPVPRDKEGVESQDRTYMNMIMTSWQIAMVGVSEELGKDSPNGELSEEESLGLES